jgi:pimeloyl-ACP methyl ester carboxylesterase
MAIRKGNFFTNSVLIFYGKNDTAFSPDLPEKMKSEFPGSRLVVMEHSSHTPFKEELGLFFGELQKYLSVIR